MEDKPTNFVGIVLTLVLLCLLIVGVYAGAYFARGKVLSVPIYVVSVGRGSAPAPSSDLFVRQFPTRWEATLFRPAAKFESLVTGRDVSTSLPPFLILD